MTVSLADIDTVYANVTAAFFDSSSNNVAGQPRIGPAVDLGPTTAGQRDDSKVNGPWWMMAQMLHFLAERASSAPMNVDAIAKVKQQAAFLTNTAQVNGHAIGYTDAQLSNTSANDDTIHVSDDAAWKILSLCDLHRVTGDGAWLNRAKSLVPSVLNFYKDPDNAQVDCGDGIMCSPYGIEYAVAGQDPNGQERSTLYEVGIALSAVYIYEKTGTAGFLNYAKKMFAVWVQYFKDTRDNQGAYWFDIHLRGSDTVDSTPLHQPIDQTQEPPDASDGNRRHPVRGSSSHSSGALMSMGALAAKLFRITGQSTYLTELNSIVQALGDVHIFRGADGLIINDRDAYTNGFHACEFVREALSQRSAGVDASGAVRNLIIATGTNIVTNGLRASHYYSADWGAPGSTRNGSTTGRTSSWDTDGGYPNNINGDMANPYQIMASGNAASMALAAYLAGSTTGYQLTDPATGAALTDPNTNEILSDA